MASLNPGCIGYLLGFCLLLLHALLTEASEYCQENYICDEGHCCGHGQCCTYYYELWWFWLIWLVIAVLSVCCFYQQKRMRRRRHRSQTPSRPSRILLPVFEPGKFFKLPSYDEVSKLPKNPPNYSVLYSTNSQETEITSSTGDCSSLAETAVDNCAMQCHINESNLVGPFVETVNYGEKCFRYADKVSLQYKNQGANLLLNEVCVDITETPPSSDHQHLNESPPPLYSQRNGEESIPTTPPPYGAEELQEYTFPPQNQTQQQ